jgi:hypothetical protein
MKLSRVDQQQYVHHGTACSTHATAFGAVLCMLQAVPRWVTSGALLVLSCDGELLDQRLCLSIIESSQIGISLFMALAICGSSCLPHSHAINLQPCAVEL